MKAQVKTRLRNPRSYLFDQAVRYYEEQETEFIQQRIPRQLARLLAASETLANRGESMLLPATRAALWAVYEAFTPTAEVAVVGGGRGATKRAKERGQTLRRPHPMLRDANKEQPVHLDLRTHRRSD